MMLPWRTKWNRMGREIETERKSLGLNWLQYSRMKEDERYPDAERRACVHCGYEMLQGYLSCHNCGRDFRNPRDTSKMTDYWNEPPDE